MKIVLSTANSGKLREMRELLEPLGFDVVSPTDFGVKLEVEETGETFYENARLKAESAVKNFGYPAIGEDSGLCVDALDGAPGLYSSRFGGEDLSDEDKCKLLLLRLVNKEPRTAKFVSTLVSIFPNGDELVAEGQCTGEITHELRGAGGFGYDPLFLLPQFGKTMAEIPPETKNKVSHRGVAMRQLAEKLAEYRRNND